MSNNTDVSIILTSYNHEQYIGMAIQSVLDQTFQHFELIIIDDCSTDSSWDIISSFSDSRIRKYRNEVRCRGAKGINESIQFRARGKYIAIHHSDDLFHPDKLAKQVAYLEGHAEVGAVFTHVGVIGEEGQPFEDSDHVYFSVFRQPNRTRHEWLRHFFYYGNCLCHPSVLIRKECYDKVGLYNRYYGSLPDFDMWVRLCLHYEIHIIQEPLTMFRVLDNYQNTSSAKPETYIRSVNEFVQICRNYISVNDLETFIKIFPQLLMEKNLSGNNLDYHLACLAINSNHNKVALNAFGLNLLYEISRSFSCDVVDNNWLIDMSAKLNVYNIKINDLENISSTGDTDIDVSVVQFNEANESINISMILKMIRSWLSNMLKRIGYL